MTTRHKNTWLVRLWMCLICTGSMPMTPQAGSRWRTAPRGQVKKWMGALGPKRLALVIGIKQYADPYWRGLKYPTQDAQSVASTFQREGKFDQILTLTSRSQTTTAALKAGLLRLKQLNKHPHDTVAVYISAHGTLSQTSGAGPFRRYVITADTTSNIPASALPVAWIRKQLTSFVSRSRLLILATCYSGDPRSKSRRPQGHKGKLVVPEVTYSKALLILSASSRGQPAYESDKLKGDVYTSFFLQCLRQAAIRYRRCLGKYRRSKGCTPVLATRLHACAVRGTARYALKHFGQRQLPGLESHINGIGQIVLVGPRTASRSQPQRLAMGTVQLLPQLSRRYRLRIFKQGEKGASPTITKGQSLLFLRPGRYKVRAISRSNQQLITRIIAIKPGQRLLLELPPTPWTPPKGPQLKPLSRQWRIPTSGSKKALTQQLALIEAHVQRRLGPFYSIKGVTHRWRKQLPPSPGGKLIYPTALAYAIYQRFSQAALSYKGVARKLARLQRADHWHFYSAMGKEHTAWRQLPQRWQGTLTHALYVRPQQLHQAGKPSQKLRHLGAWIEAHLQRRLGTSTRAKGITLPWQQCVAKLATRAQSAILLTPSSVAWTAYQGLQLRGIAAPQVARLLCAYQRVGSWLMTAPRNHQKWNKLKVLETRTPVY